MGLNKRELNLFCNGKLNPMTKTKENYALLKVVSCLLLSENNNTHSTEKY